MRTFKKHDIGLSVVLVLISTWGFSVYPILGKFLFTGGASLPTVLFFRFALAALIFWIITIYLEGVPRFTVKTGLILWGMGGIGYSSMAGFYLTSVRYIPASLAALMLYTYPIVVTIVSVLSKQEKFSRYKFIGLSLTTFGLLSVLGLAVQGINLLGITFALSAALVYSIYILIGNRLLQTTTPLATITLISTSAAATYGVIGLAMGGITWNLSMGTWLGIGGITLFSTIIAMLTFFQGMKRLGATSTSIISTMEPVMTVIMAVLIYNEHLTFFQAIGGIFVVLGGILAVYSPSLRLTTDDNPSTQFKNNL